MISKENDLFLELKKIISRENRIVRELSHLLDSILNYENIDEKKIIENQIKSLKEDLSKTNSMLPLILNRFNLVKSLPSQETYVINKISEKEETKISTSPTKVNFKKTIPELDKESIKRIKKGEKIIVVKKEKKPNPYVVISNRIFSDYSASLIDKRYFKGLEGDLIKSNMSFLLRRYVSIIFFTTVLSFFVSVLLFFFFLFFNLGVNFPIITYAAENFSSRFLKTFWIIFVVPVSTLIFMYFYPRLERGSIEKKINQELPFATINMAAISASMINPTNIFSIISSTEEYPYLKKEFAKLLNSVNVLGYDLVSVLRESAFNTSSKKLVDLYTGLATTISSGGDLPKFFSERAETLLFEYNLEKEKSTKSAETFMDIYISVVIAAPMILMLLLMMMKISGLGISLSTTLITLIMILGVSGINVLFLIFLQIKQTNN